MGSTLEQLRQEMGNIRKKTAEVGKELRQLLTEYLSVLGRSVSKQLVLSGFHLCTQVYPEAFLSRPVSERESLQQNIKTIGQQLTVSLAEIQQPLQGMEPDAEVDPTLLLEVWETIETSMVEALREGSRQINQQLQDAQIMTIKSLDKLLHMAAQAQDSGRSVTNPPHLLKALVDPKELLEEDLEPVVVIYLQLSDLEFTDPELMSWRQKLRPLRQKLTQLQQTYSQKQEEQLTAEAISAWRASWTDSDFLHGGSMDG
jgi:BMFP domain-containing protein YqiC